ncbi:hypothetical protein [Fretibacter rubidus]|uniref:hypothetical protein n=1 Tax=Fretibacter rubidus TaxID=570162 RepID=UPI00352AFAA1
MTDLNITHTPLTPWPVRPVADPRRAKQPQFMDGMCEILKYEGPMQALHLFQSYAKAGGLMKVTAGTRSLFVRALKQGVKDGLIALDRETDSEVSDDDDPVGWVLRLPDTPLVIVRTLGDRSFAEIPTSELAALILDIRAQDDMLGREDIYRAVLEHYGLQKLTALVRRRLDHVLAAYF